jgi:hypothetical protein
MPLKGNVIADIRLSDMQAILEAIRSDAALNGIFGGKPLESLAFIGAKDGVMIAPLASSGLSEGRKREFVQALARIMGGAAEKQD